MNWVEKTGIDFIQSFTKEKVGTDTVWPDTSADASKAAGQLITEKNDRSSGRRGRRNLRA